MLLVASLIGRTQDAYLETLEGNGAAIRADETVEEGEAVSSSRPPWITIPRTVDKDVRVPFAVAAFIGRMLRAPFDYLPLTPAELSDSEYRDHVIRTCQSLHGLADVRWLRAADTTERRENVEDDNV